MDKKGIILSVYIYILLVFFLLIIGSLLVVLNNTRILSEKIKNSAISKVDNMKYGFSIDIDGDKTICQNYGQAYVEPGFSAKDKDGNSLEVTVTSDLDIWKIGTYTIKYTSRYNNKEKTSTRNVIVMKNNYSYIGNYQTFTAPCDGIYRIELWGAQGGMSSGNGGYVKGEISINKESKLYIYVGGSGADRNSTCIGGYNGGGSSMVVSSSFCGSTGGGATDIRLVKGVWNNVNSLRSRIMIAAGGGGAGQVANPSSYAGGLSGFNGTIGDTYQENQGLGGTQISGGVIPVQHSCASAIGTAGGFGGGGIGGTNSLTTTDGGGGGGGGGYYGGSGSSGLCNGGWSGGGGSSFISGYPGCNAIDANGNHTNQPVHYSGIKFNNMVMLAGNKTMPSVSGGTETGHSGNGYAKITYLGTSNNSEYTMKKFVAIGNNNGIKLRIQKPEKATSVMVRRKETPWTNTDTTSTGTLISDNITITNADNIWYSDDTAVNGTTYYYKAFPLVNGSYRYLPYQNETSAIGGGLVTEYLMEGDLLDTSGVDAHSNGDADITYQSGKLGRTASFNGSSSYIYSPTFLDSDTYSISAWVYSNGVPATNVYIVSTAEGGGSYLAQLSGANAYSSGTYFGGTYQINSITLPIINKWIHLTHIINTTDNIVKVYINGTLVSQKVYGEYTGSTLLETDRRTCIGCNPDAGLVATNFFNGKIDQVRMYNRELLPDEVLSLYNE